MNTENAQPLPERLSTYERNASKHAQDPCIRCGRSINVDTALWVLTIYGADMLPADVEPDYDHPAYSGFFPVGSECAKKIPAGFARTTL